MVNESTLNSMPPGAPERKLLGMFGIFDRISIFLTSDSIEEETRTFGDIERHRIYLDDIAMVTRSKQYDVALLIPSAICTAFFGVLCVTGFIVAAVSTSLRLQQNFLALAVVTSGPAVLFAVRIVLHLITKDEIISIFGRRKKIEVRFGVFKKKRCEESYVALLVAVRAANQRAHERAALEQPFAVPVAEPVSEFPMPPAALSPEISGVSVEPLAPPPFEMPSPVPVAPADVVTVSEDGLFVEYNPRSLPARPAKPVPPIPREPDLPLMPEIKITPKEPESSGEPMA